MPGGHDFALQVAALEEALDGLDYFALLRVPRTARPAEIQAAYHRLARTFHPDLVLRRDDAALRARVSRIFKRITEAYTVLRDDDRRRRYRAGLDGAAPKLRWDHA